MLNLLKKFLNFFKRDERDLRTSILHFRPDPTTKPPTSRRSTRIINN